LPNFNDVQEYIRSQQEQARAARESQRKSIVQVGHHARTVVEHPSWQVYVDHIETMKAKAEDDLAQLIKQMADGDEHGEKLTAMKMHLKYLNGLVQGYSHAVELIPELLRRAQEASR